MKNKSLDSILADGDKGRRRGESNKTQEKGMHFFTFVSVFEKMINENRIMTCQCNNEEKKSKSNNRVFIEKKLKKTKDGGVRRYQEGTLHREH